MLVSYCAAFIEWLKRYFDNYKIFSLGFIAVWKKRLHSSLPSCKSTFQQPQQRRTVCVSHCLYFSHSSSEYSGWGGAELVQCHRAPLLLQTANLLPTKSLLHRMPQSWNRGEHFRDCRVLQANLIHKAGHKIGLCLWDPQFQYPGQMLKCVKYNISLVISCRFQTLF